MDERVAARANAYVVLLEITLSNLGWRGGLVASFFAPDDAAFMANPGARYWMGCLRGMADAMADGDVRTLLDSISVHGVERF